MTKTGNDYGASHDFGSGRRSVRNETNELRIGRSVYMKASMLTKINEYAQHNNLTLSAAFDAFLQCGYAWKMEKALQIDPKLSWLDV